MQIHLSPVGLGFKKNTVQTSLLSELRISQLGLIPQEARISFNTSL